MLLHTFEQSWIKNTCTHFWKRREHEYLFNDKLKFPTLLLYWKEKYKYNYVNKTQKHIKDMLNSHYHTWSIRLAVIRYLVGNTNMTSHVKPKHKEHKHGHTPNTPLVSLNLCGPGKRAGGVFLLLLHCLFDLPPSSYLSSASFLLPIVVSVSFPPAPFFTFPPEGQECEDTPDLLKVSQHYAIPSLSSWQLPRSPASGNSFFFFYTAALFVSTRERFLSPLCYYTVIILHFWHLFHGL